MFCTLALFLSGWSLSARYLILKGNWEVDVSSSVNNVVLLNCSCDSFPMSSISNVLKHWCFSSKRNRVMIMNVIDALFAH